jgi:hypothetical protein
MATEIGGAERPRGNISKLRANGRLGWKRLNYLGLTRQQCHIRRGRHRRALPCCAQF